MPNIKEFEYIAGYPKDNKFVEVMKASISYELYNKLSQSELDSWLHSMLMGCPAYKDKEDLGNHIHWSDAKPIPAPKPPF